MHDEAVSPTIGVILMVAVVVGVGALVFAGLQGEEEPTAAKGLPLLNHEHEDRISVARADEDQTWERHAIRTAEPVDGLHFHIGEGPATDTDPTLRNEYAALSGGPIRAGQSIWFCGEQELEDVTIMVRDGKANAVIHRTTFADIAEC